MIKYIGSKRLLVPAIEAIAKSLPRISNALDLFSGTTRVAQVLKGAGLHVHANDSASYSEVLGRCYIETDSEAIAPSAIDRLLGHLQALPPREGYVTEVLCRRARYFHPKNGARIDAMREGIESSSLGRAEHAIALTSLLEAADRVDSTTGLQMAFLKEWAPRALGDLVLRAPRLLPGRGCVTKEDANRLVRDLPSVDLVYVDPPYNQHSFYRNYHVWETLVRNDRPDVYGVACKRVDCRERRSAYNSRPAFMKTLRDLFDHLQARYVLLSCSSEGYLDLAAAPSLLAAWGKVGAVEVDFKRYVGAQIGIHNPRGEKVGRVSHLRNREFLLLAGPDRDAVSAATAAAAAALRAASRHARVVPVASVDRISGRRSGSMTA